MTLGEPFEEVWKRERAGLVVQELRKRAERAEAQLAEAVDLLAHPEHYAQDWRAAVDALLVRCHIGGSNLAPWR